jgi:hypothetical protein
MRRIVHTSAAALAAILLIATPIGLGATPRLDGMGMPTLSFSAAVPASFPNLQFQADDFGQGASFVRDVYDPFEFPQTLVDRDLFPRSRAIFNYTGAGQGSGGVYLNLDGLLNRPFAVGVYANAPDRNGAAIGEGRGDLAGLGATFGADVTNAVTTFGSLPGAPANIADLFVAAQLGSMVSLGASFGLAYDKTADDSNSIVGTAGFGSGASDRVCFLTTHSSGKSIWAHPCASISTAPAM